MAISLIIQDTNIFAAQFSTAFLVHSTLKCTVRPPSIKINLLDIIPKQIQAPHTHPALLSRYTSRLPQYNPDQRSTIKIKEKWEYYTNPTETYLAEISFIAISSTILLPWDRAFANSRIIRPLTCEWGCVSNIISLQIIEWDCTYHKVLMKLNQYTIQGLKKSCGPL